MASEIDNWKNLSYSRKLAWQKSTPEDCSFIIGEEPNARTLSAHKGILASASETFNSMFNGNYKEADASFNIPLPNVVDYMVFKVIVEYIYYYKTDTIEFLDLERLKHVAYLADYYMLDRLLQICHLTLEAKAVSGSVSFHDSLQIFEYQKKLNRMVKAAKTCSSYPSTVLTTNTSIYDLEPPYFYDLLRELNVFKEAERFCLIENYAKIHGLKMDRFFINYKKSDDTEEVDSRTLTQTKSLKEMFELISFKKMSANEFKNGPAVSKVWNIAPEEKLLILKTLVASGR